MCFLCDLKTSPAPTPQPAPQRGPWQARRAFVLAGAAAVALPAAAQVDVGKASSLRKLVPADQIEQAGSQQFVQTVQEAKQQNALLPASHPQTRRLHAIAKRIIPHAAAWNPRARDWRWEVVLINSDQINAFCLPGGKIAFYTGILSQLKLDDDEAAMIMGHEMAHALREHARERLAKSSATDLGLRLGAQLLGLGDLGNVAAGLGTQLLTLRFSREDESEADLVGLELAARAAFQPRASVSLWQKMATANKGGGPAFLSTHPSGPNRIRELQANVPKVQALYERARRG
ncbi:MAG: M48 family metallopeptidase [Gammaproteobacteria bacterium]|uniref:M48 family metallopeptidase n=1 Tax=Hydrogenophaga sp. TaxID=1904254 RepID=UPI0025BCEC63|nr:M48 family metallopeptidase [Hydrogenophaga sp.]MBU4181197.1 M48 family metallopeptidase [Gammaproteobacteria bacterium]MBU4281441.1 M48 family metallopeptidase [Gammaproteobacteria bacterium]MBU4505243.1 M48 family metallopeptidase [Gammaproteobacteria bacterium]MCG2654906.1 M48 family metallopeptidase [Hydrogenophaga sp.]